MGNGKGGGFDYDAESVRAFAAVFAEAQSEVTKIQGELGTTTAKAPDWGKAWAGKQGAEYESYMQSLAADLANLATHLGEISATLNQGTDLVVESDSSGYTNIKKVEDRLGKTPPTSTGNSQAV
ncbi:MAG TPA: WXG100 family type VII secretion target [Actinokineospora sp.]|nr:WXG100 family type VII secretion target [Actinokineospora sp.]